MTVRIGHASINENNKVTGGKHGDQTKKEVCIRTWYNGNFNVMLVCTDTVIAQKAVEYMTAICEDDDFGYCQNTRTSGYLAIVNAKGKVASAIPSSFDCSSLVASCYKLAGLNINYNCTTRTLRKALLATGKFIEYTDKAHLTTSNYAVPGAIYLREGNHVVMSLDYGSNAAKPSPYNGADIDVDLAQNEVTIWNFFKAKSLTDYAVAGLMGNLYAESGLSQINLQNTGNKSLGLTDSQYTNAVDSNVYTNFVKDSQGYGLAQWTYHTRKKALLEYAKSKNTSIGDLQTQLEFLYKELSTSYKTQLNKINKATSVKEASDVILKEYEQPANQGSTVQTKRANYGNNYYNKYAKIQQATTTKFVKGKTYTLQVELKVRAGAGTNYTAKTHNGLTADEKQYDKDKDGALDKGTKVVCLDVKQIGSDIWIKIDSGWIAGYYKNQHYIK